MMSHLTTLFVHLISSMGYVGVFILMTLESALIPIPSEVTMPFAGFLVHSKELLFPVVVLIGALGNLVGSLIGYYIGFILEENVLVSLIRKYGKFILLTEHDYRTSEHWFRKYGAQVVFFSRLIPGIRTFISLPAGMFEMNIWKFSLYTFIGSLIWSTILTGVGFYLGSKWDTLGPIFSKFHVIIFIALILLALAYLNHKTKFVHKIQRSLRKPQQA